jgi:glycosyltransferase involved in cell wall biosynthesis
MQCGTPVIASNTSSIPEVVGKAAMLFDPADLDQLISSIEILIDSPSRIDDYRRRGFRQAKLFTWENTANITFNLYRSLL